MSIGPLSSIAGSVAGTSLAQTRGSEIDRAQQENAARELVARGDEQAEMAAGVGQTDGENHQTAERDADGRRPWEFPRRPDDRPAEQDAGPEGPQPGPVQDPTGQSGGLLDVSG
jgi:hypothetical protein